MWMKMIAFGATASILALSACSVSDDEYANADGAAVEDDSGEAPLAAKVAQYGGSKGGTPCGNNVCGRGESCCNASCGWCVPEGVSCIQIACEQPLPAQ